MGMPGFHVTSKEGWNYREDTCGRWKGILLPGVGGGGIVPEKYRAGKGGGTAHVEGGMDRQRGSGWRPRSWKSSYRGRIWGCYGPGRGRLPLGAGRQQKSLHFIGGEMALAPVGGVPCLLKGHPDFSVSQISCCSFGASDGFGGQMVCQGWICLAYPRKEPESRPRGSEVQPRTLKIAWNQLP